MIFLIWLAVLACSIVLYLYKTYSRFSKHGVKYFKPIPVIGNSGPMILRKIHFVENFIRLYNAFPEERFLGNYEFLRPRVVVKDLELIKKIAIKDFDYFLDHSQFVDETVDPLLARSLFSLRGQEWKDMRSTLSPAFTSSKMRLMVPFMIEVCNLMIKSLKTNIEVSKDNYVDVECRDLAGRFANDVIASCAFGIKVDSHNEKDNKFYEMGKLTTNVSTKQLLVMLAYNTLPKAFKKFNITSFFDPATRDFFKSLLTNMMNEREEKNIYRPDMVHLLMQAKQGKLIHDSKNLQDDDAGFATVEETGVGKNHVDRVWSDNDLVAQALLFFFAGFDTIATAMSFLLYDVATSPKVQERLVQEIKENQLKCGEKFDYKSVQNMTYMDMVVSESLRKWPPGAVLDRVCLKDYNLGRPNSQATHDYIVRIVTWHEHKIRNLQNTKLLLSGRTLAESDWGGTTELPDIRAIYKLSIRKGEMVNVPVWAIHHDPKYFPNPEKFDPERFSAENKHLIIPYTYMPFGLGPRNCIGSRFALCEVKVMLYHLLLHFQVSPSEKTCIPAKLDTARFSLSLKGGHWLRFKMRNQ